MSFKKLSNRTDHSYNSYLSTLDLINKYNISEKRKKPILNQILLILPLNDFINKFIDRNLNEFDSEVQIKSIVFLYLLTFNIPFIQFKKLKFIKTKDNCFSLKISLTDTFSKDQFLTRLFIERKNFSISNFKIMKQKSLNLLLPQKKFTLSSFISIKTFFELENLFNRVFLGSNSNEFLIKIHFIFQTSSEKAINYKNFVKNYPCFWVNS